MPSSLALYSMYCAGRFLFGEFPVLNRNFMTFLVVPANNGLRVTDTLIGQRRRKVCIYIGSCIFADRYAIHSNTNKAIYGIDILVHSHDDKNLLFFGHIKLYCF